MDEATLTVTLSAADLDTIIACLCDVDDIRRSALADELLLDLTADYGQVGDIADKLGVKTTSLAPVRANLIKKGMVYSPSHGEMAFTVPLFDAFMRRAMPRFEP